VVRTLSLGHTLTVIQEVTTGSEWTHGCYTARKQDAKRNGTLEEFKTKSKDVGKEFEKEEPLSTAYQFFYLYTFSILNMPSMIKTNMKSWEGGAGLGLLKSDN